MKKRVLGLLFVLLFFISFSSFAKHIAGGEMSYVYLGPSNSASNTGRYSVTLKLYRDCNTDGAQLDANATITIYQTGSSSFFANRSVPLTSRATVALSRPDPCISNPPVICYDVGYYTFEIDLPFTSSGYTISYQRCCRIDGIFNVVNSQNAGVTYTATVPGTSSGASAPVNSSPVFKTSDTVVICARNYFYYDFGASDVDNDQLSYRFEEAYLGGTTQGPAPTVASAPPYNSLNYSFGFSPQMPLGSGVQINATTGMISGTAPVAGIYVITVAVVETRGGQVINVHRKDLHLKVADCSIAAADLDPVSISCDGFTLNFKNNSTSSLIKTYDWDFGVAASSTDVSTSPSPSFTFPAAGDYTVRLITNLNDQCSDTGYTVAKVYPGFTTDFSVQETCKGVPYVFQDLSRTVYGSINKWKWDFGNANATNDTANTATASYVFAQTGVYSVSLIVSNSIGCTDTVMKQVTVSDKPTLTLNKDTLICNIDTLQLNASGTGVHSWSPNYNISNTGISNPLVSPDVPTRYTVTLTQSPGCINSASVFVDVKSFVTLKAGNDTTICLGDSVLLRPMSDGVNYLWSPAGSVSNPTGKNAWAKPTQTTRYSVLSTIGKCQAMSGFVITTVPFPKAFAGLDTSICYGSQVRLRATGGSRYMWYPGNTLNDPTRQDPIASPRDTTSYIVGVYEDKGCPRPAYDTVRVSVVPRVKAFAGNDTAVVVGQPLQMLATGGLKYSWNPSVFLNNGLIADPVALLNDDVSFVVRVSTKEGCYAFDTVRVKVYKTPPEIFVPTAFTPNEDGLNDRLIPIPVGISKMVYFKVYNRYGELVFSTEEIGRGWNGMYKGRDQGNESFVWHALGVDYLGNTVFRKGQSTLIR